MHQDVFDEAINTINIMDEYLDSDCNIDAILDSMRTLKSVTEKYEGDYQDLNEYLILVSTDTVNENSTRKDVKKRRNAMATVINVEKIK